MAWWPLIRSPSSITQRVPHSRRCKHVSVPSFFSRRIMLLSSLVPRDVFFFFRRFIVGRKSRSFIGPRPFRRARALWKCVETRRSAASPSRRADDWPSLSQSIGAAVGGHIPLSFQLAHTSLCSVMDFNKLTALPFYTIWSYTYKPVFCNEFKWIFVSEVPVELICYQIGVYSAAIIVPIKWANGVVITFYASSPSRTIGWIFRPLIDFSVLQSPQLRVLIPLWIQMDQQRVAIEVHAYQPLFRNGFEIESNFQATDWFFATSSQLEALNQLVRAADWVCAYVWSVIGHVGWRGRVTHGKCQKLSNHSRPQRREWTFRLELMLCTRVCVCVCVCVCVNGHRNWILIASSTIFYFQIIKSERDSLLTKREGFITKHLLTIFFQFPVKGNSNLKWFIIKDPFLDK